jgi:hypothetical protein
MDKLIRSAGAIFGTVRAFYRQAYNRYFEKVEKFSGTPQEICEQIIEKLWRGDFYRTSLGHFDFFWTRDFGTVTESLTKLGHGEKVRQTLQWALLHFMEANHVTQCIDNAGNTFNAPAKKSVDALPWLLHSLVVSKYTLRPLEKKFLNQRLHHYAIVYLDPKTGDLKPHIRYAELRDAVNYDRSAYAISLIARLSVCAKELGLSFPFDVKVYQKILNDVYWNGRFFRADRSVNAWSSECGLMPFHLGIIEDGEKANQTLDYIEKLGYQKLYPLEYCKDWKKFHYRFGMGHLIMPNYTGTTIWTWHGTFYLYMLKKYKRPEYAREYAKFEQLILRHRTYPELLNPDGSWYKAPFYSSDPGMIWAALFLALPHPKK